MKTWPLLRDILLTGTGVFVILSQVYSARPSDVLLAVAMGLTAPAAYEHVRALLSGPGGGSSSPSPPSAGALPSPSSPGDGADDG